MVERQAQGWCQQARWRCWPRFLILAPHGGLSQAFPGFLGVSLQGSSTSEASGFRYNAGQPLMLEMGTRRCQEKNFLN